MRKWKAGGQGGANVRVAEAQSGYFTAEQAAEAGYSQRMLSHYTGSGRIERRGRGIYRLVHFPQVSYAEDLVVAWRWSERSGVYSHATALQLHQLSDAMHARATMTLPTIFAKRRLRVPAGLRLRFADVEEREREFVGGVPVTTPARTVNDCALASIEPRPRGAGSARRAPAWSVREVGGSARTRVRARARSVNESRYPAASRRMDERTWRAAASWCSMRRWTISSIDSGCISKP